MRANLGCGRHVHEGWINIDLASSEPGVLVHDLSTGIPLPEQSCSIVYHSHVLEHLDRAKAHFVLRECHRILKPEGVLRVAVPDLEQICRTYLVKLEEAVAGKPGSASDYEWMMLELYDQTVREESGGSMAAYLRAVPLESERFVIERIGEEGKYLISSLRDPLPIAQRTRTPSALLKAAVRRIRRNLVQALVQVIDGTQAAAVYRSGSFRMSGEIHRWMYDRYSLARLMASAGFVDVRQVSAHSSRISEWADVNLDVLPDGTIRKPDSIFMEAQKPS